MESPLKVLKLYVVAAAITRKAAHASASLLHRRYFVARLDARCGPTDRLLDFRQREFATNHGKIRPRGRARSQRHVASRASSAAEEVALASRAVAGRIAFRC